MPTFYVSYRSADSSNTMTALLTKLRECYGASNIILVQEMANNKDYQNALDHALRNVDAILIIIGKQWFTAMTDAGERKIDQTNDVVHYEVAMAFAFQKPIIAIRIDGADIPTAAMLPEDIRDLAKHKSMTYANSADLAALQLRYPPPEPELTTRLPVHREDPSTLGMPIVILSALVFFSIFGKTALFFLPDTLTSSSYCFVPILFLADWLLVMIVTSQQRRWGLLAAITLPLIITLLGSCILITLALTRYSHTAGWLDNRLIFSFLVGYYLSGGIALLLVFFGLNVAGKLSFKLR